MQGKKKKKAMEADGGLNPQRPQSSYYKSVQRLKKPRLNNSRNV